MQARCPVELREKICCCNSLMISRNQEYFFLCFHEWPNNAFCAHLCECKVAAQYHEVNILFLGPIRKPPRRCLVSMDITRCKNLELFFLDFDFCFFYHLCVSFPRRTCKARRTGSVASVCFLFKKGSFNLLKS